MPFSDLPGDTFIDQLRFRSNKHPMFYIKAANDEEEFYNSLSFHKLMASDELLRRSKPGEMTVTFPASV